MKNLVAIILLCGLSVMTVAQNKLTLDSLQVSLNNAKEDTSRIKILWSFFDLYSNASNSNALKYAQEALELSRKSGDKQYIIRSLRYVSNSNMLMGNYKEAMQYSLENLNLCKEKGDNIELFSRYNELGIINDRLLNYTESLDYYFKALNIYNTSTDGKEREKLKTVIQSLYNNIGNIYLTKGDYGTAEQYYLKAEKIAVDNNDLRTLSIIYNNLGKVKSGQDSLQKAYVYLKDALDTRKKINDLSGIGVSYYYLAAYYQQQGDFKKGINYAEKAYKQGMDVNSLLISRTGAYFLYQLFDSLQMYDSAYYYHKVYKALNDSIVNKETYKEIERLKMQNDFDLLQKERDAKEQRMKYTYIIVFSSLVLGIVILLLLFLLSRNKQKRIRMEKNKLEKEVDLRNRELATNVMYLVKKNEFLISISDRLLKIKGKLKEENKNEVQKIIFDLQDSMDKEVWEDFEYRFNQVHTEFYTNLQDKFPDLTPAERKLAAFLRLNLTTKEIASITNQNIKSVETARYRLRKKLGIANTDVNIINFLLDI